MPLANDLRIDLGCGSTKKEGTLGLDILDVPGVDYVLDLTARPLPFEDRTVSYVHSSHFFEHLADLGPIFKEISRVSKDGAELEFWTPYAWSNSAFVMGHKTFMTEDIYLHLQWYSDFWSPILGAYWILHEFRYVIKPEILVYLYQQEVPLDFAVRHLKDVVVEFCALATVSHSITKPASPAIRRTFCTGRFEPAHTIRQATSGLPLDHGLLAKAISSNAED